MTHIGSAAAGKLPIATGQGKPVTFTTLTFPSTSTANEILYSSANNTVTGLASTARSVLTTNSTAVPTWVPLTDGQLIIGSTAGSPAASTLTAGTGISISNGSNSISISVNSSTVGQTITGDTGGALSPTAGNWNIVSTATNGIETTGSGSTLTVAMASPYGDGSFAFTRSASGATNTLTIENTSNTASSNALQQVSVGGSSAGDPFTTYTVTGVTSWSLGIDNSASDTFVIAASTALGTSNALTIDTSGNAFFNNIATSTEITLAMRNSDTNAASNSRIVSSVVNGSAADPYLQVSIEAVTNFCYGIDNSDSDKLKICYDANAASATPSGSNQYWVMTTAGERTMPLQPAFMAYVNTNINNITGDGTLYTIIFDTESFDQNGDFDLATSTFTAPVTGKYFFGLSLLLGGGTLTSLVSLRIATTGTTFQRAIGNSSGSTISSTGEITALVSMTAGDTAVFQVQGTDTGGKVLDINGTTGGVLRTWVEGYLVC